jgi:hypothetical protein
MPSIFNNRLIENKLKTKQIEFLNMALEAYRQAYNSMSNNKGDSTNSTDLPVNGRSPAAGEESSSSAEQKNNNQLARTSSKSESSNNNNKNGNSPDYEENDEEWLNHYMFGKIKEKLDFDIMDCLEHYKIVGHLFCL